MSISPNKKELISKQKVIKNQSKNKIKCKFCGSKHLVKNGFMNGKQRYRCRDCNKNPIIGDKRIKHSLQKRKLALTMYINNMGIRAIARVLSICFNTKIYNNNIAHWIKNAGKILEEELKTRKQNKEPRKIEILEMDELFTYIKKRQKKSEYGLLLIGTEMKLVHLKSLLSH